MIPLPLFNLALISLMHSVEDYINLIQLFTLNIVTAGKCGVRKSPEHISFKDGSYYVLFTNEIAHCTSLYLSTFYEITGFWCGMFLFK